MTALMEAHGIETRSIPGFDGYFVNSRAEVFSSLRGALYRLRPRMTKAGYLCFSATVAGKAYQVYVHRAVALAFHVRHSDFDQVNHIDGDKLNNVPKNLEWCSPFENKMHARDTGLIAKGEEHGRAILTETQVRAIRKAYDARTGSYWGASEFGRLFGVTADAVSNAATRKTWKWLDPQ